MKVKEKMKSKSIIKEFYENFTNKLIRDKIYPNPRHIKIKKYLEEIFSRTKFNSALEIGCGIGVISEFIAKNVNSVAGIDISEENIRFAKKTVKNINFYCADFFDFNTKEKFDLITLFDVLEHFPKSSHRDVFDQIDKLSSSNCFIAITIPDPHYLSFMRKHHPEELQIVDESIYLEELNSIFSAFNFEIIKYEKYGIDYDNQYRFYLLSRKKEKYILEKVINTDRNKLKSILRKFANRITIIRCKWKYGKFLKK